MSVRNPGIARVIFQFTTNSLILTHHTQKAINPVITWNASLYFALIHFFPAASSAVSIRENIRINAHQTSNPRNALFS
jgi:hypothetical protein